MYVEPELKPLYANLKRLNIGDYLYTQEFNLFALENNIDEIWEECKKEIRRKKNVIKSGKHNTEEEEEAFMLLISGFYEDDEENSFDAFIFDILLNFAEWSQTKLDFTGVISNLKDINVPKEDLLYLTKKIRKIQVTKPIKLIAKVKIKPDTEQNQIIIKSNKIFVVHGRDDKSRLEICNLLKDDLKLEPIVLQDKPNNSIETIISKFERLASDCSAAIVLFTPDDDSGDNKRARQNVILELGYFLGKFQDENNRRIIILKKGNLEIPSDISGVLYLEYSKTVKEVYYDLKKQFEYWGY
jgi:predicted nucleotide-binding protein